MMQCEAFVVAVTNDNEVLVEVPARLAACDHCPNPAGCQTTNLLARTNQPRRYLVSNTLGLGVGDHVSLSVAEGTVFRAAMASYGMPLILIICGAVVGQWLAGDGAAALGVLLGLIIGFILLRYRERSFHKGYRSIAHPFSLQKYTNK
ncbi:MAG TPA: SoxR reducing system RseC family protein [Rugosibacter sp.]